MPDIKTLAICMLPGLAIMLVGTTLLVNLWRKLGAMMLLLGFLATVAHLSYTLDPLVRREVDRFIRPTTARR